jgi:hypothetical protein
MLKTEKKDKNVNFFEIPIPASYGKIKNKIYHIVENEKPVVMETFRDIAADLQDKIKDLICKMATVEDYQSPIITYHLHGYNYGEIRPMPHRFFFFSKYGDSFIFFGYVLKKKNSLNDSFYRNMNRDKERYEKEFEKFVARNRTNI